MVAWFLSLKAILLKRSRLERQLEAVKADNLKTTGHPSATQVTVPRDKVTSSSCIFTVDELSEAEMATIRYCRQLRFSEEIAALSSSKATVSRQSSLYRLDAVLDDGLFRVGGRLSKGAMPEKVKHPLILSKDQNVSSLILKYVHQHLGYSGHSHTRSAVRKTFLITNVNSAVWKVISECGFCRRYNGRAIEDIQKMADLPKVRVLPDLPPFTNTGVNNVGPVRVKRGRSTCKRYRAICTCMSSRAVHLEVAVPLEQDACINALLRFISRKGQVVQLMSDNGTNFIGAERELREAVSALNHDQIQGVLSQVGNHWSFNPPAGSHHGGVWERMIRLVRRVLSSVLRQQTLDDDGLHTVLWPPLYILNDRPITQLSNDPNDLELLILNHLPLLRGKPALPPGVFGPHDQYKMETDSVHLRSFFWKRWV